MKELGDGRGPMPTGGRGGWARTVQSCAVNKGVDCIFLAYWVTNE